tara:strand:- start:14613 stop:15518 length:906 start_codon:yes stop_codon:yes gene_type:complete
MIRIINRNDLDVEKYDSCIEKSIQSTIYALSWYLDITCDNWEVLVLNDFEAVMPIPWRKKFNIKYVYQPLWVLELGIYSKNGSEEEQFLKVLFESYKYVNIRMNLKNDLEIPKSYSVRRKMQLIALENHYDSISKDYNRNRRRDLVKAKTHGLIENWNAKPEALVTLFKQNVGKRISKISNQDYENLVTLIQECKRRGKGHLLEITNEENQMISAAFFVTQGNKVTEVVCSSDFDNRDNGANTYMNDRAIHKFHTEYTVFNFGGSSKEGIARYYKSMGGVDHYYNEIHYNNLPRLLKLFKN